MSDKQKKMVEKDFPIEKYLKNKNNATSKGECIACNSKVAWTRARVSSHRRATCKGIGEEERQLWKNLEEKKVLVEVKSLQSKSSTISNTSEVAVTSKNVNKVESFLDKCTKAEAEKINEICADFFFKCGVPFRIVDSQPFRHLMETMRPAFANNFLFHADKLKTTMLTEKYNKMKAKALKEISKASCFVIVCDGTKLSNGRHLINFVIHIPDHSPIFWKSEDTTAIHENKEVVASLIENVALEFDVKKWAGVVFDNVKVNQAVEKILEAKYPWVFAQGGFFQLFSLFSL